MTDSRRQANAKWRASHREKYNAYHRNLRAKNPERYKEYQVRYWKKKIDSMKESEV